MVCPPIDTVAGRIGWGAGDTATWGGMIAEGRQIIYQSPWIMALAIACVIVSVVGFNLLGDGLRAALDPVQRQ